MISVALEGALSPKHVISVVSAKVRRLNSFSRKHTLKTGDAEFERCGNLPGKEARRKDGSLKYRKCMIQGRGEETLLYGLLFFFTARGWGCLFYWDSRKRWSKLTFQLHKICYK